MINPRPRTRTNPKTRTKTRTKTNPNKLGELITIPPNKTYKNVLASL